MAGLRLFDLFVLFTSLYPIRIVYIDVKYLPHEKSIKNISI